MLVSVTWSAEGLGPVLPGGPQIRVSPELCSLLAALPPSPLLADVAALCMFRGALHGSLSHMCLLPQ